MTWLRNILNAPQHLTSTLTARGWGLLAAVIAAVVIWVLILAWGQARYDAGRTAGAAEADARWRAAAQRLEQRLDRSAAAADRREHRVEHPL